MTEKLFDCAPEDAQRFADLGCGIMDRAAADWDDLRIIQEMLVVGIPRVFAYELFHVKMNRRAPMTCVHCKHRFTTGDYRKRWCRNCNARGPVVFVSGEARKRMSARAMANVAVRRGAIKRQPCESCGAELAEKHHPDYTKPYDVIWLCRPCHMQKHAGART